MSYDARLHAIIKDETERYPRYTALIKILGECHYTEIRLWCLKKYRPQRHTPLLAVIDTASAYVATGEKHARKKKRNWLRKTRFPWRSKVIAQGTEHLHAILETALFQAFTRTAAEHGWQSGDDCLKTLTRNLVNGRTRQSRA